MARRSTDSVQANVREAHVKAHRGSFGESAGAKSVRARPRFVAGLSAAKYLRNRSEGIDR